MKLNQTVENLNCTHCGAKHIDIDSWADKPHKTHLCLSCDTLFEGTIKAVSHPTYTQAYLDQVNIDE